MNSIPVSMFGRLFTKKARLSFDSHHVVIHQENTIAIDWQALHLPPSFAYGVLGQTITFATNKQRYRFSMQAYGINRQLQAQFEQLWVNANMAQLESVLKQINHRTASQFLRQSHVKDIIRLAQQEYARWLPWIKNSTALHQVDKKIVLLTQYAHWQTGLTVHLQNRYVKEQLKRFKHFFDTVETNPLTQNQRRACIIDDDNNLLLAGAGTGKTSVMIGRAGFLVQSKQATYDDILLLAFGRLAADEMDQRIQKKLSTDKIKAATFHRVGLSIITQVEKTKPTMSAFAQDEKAKAEWVHMCLESLIKHNESYWQLVLRYVCQYYYVEKNEFDFDTLGDYYHYLNENDVRSIKGDKVNSFGELYIANWLFNHGIEYQYKVPYKSNIKTSDRRAYKPSFYLPKYAIYITYYSIDEAGNTAAYIDTKQYHQTLERNRQLHLHHQTQCIELTYGQLNSATLLKQLEKSLLDLGADINMLPKEELLLRLKDSGRISDLARLLTHTLSLYKAADLNTETETAIINRAFNKKQTEIGLALLKPILSAYNEHLQKRHEIDFEDMINKATYYVESGQFKSPWRYIMVDEFQDISHPRARLVKALRDSQLGGSVFAVGDDWQAIYRFNGADIKLTTNFAHYFGFTTQMQLDCTFRFNNKLAQVASAFITKNPGQLNKTMSSLVQVSAPAVSILRRERAANAVLKHDSNTLPELKNGALDEVLDAIYNNVTTPSSVYLLARFWFQLPNNNAMQALQARYPLLKIQTHTFHAAKGKEADYVVIIGLQKGSQGFPSQKVTPAIVDALLPEQESFAYAEERRLFYVALSRPKKRAYIITEMTNMSCFVSELMTDDGVELNEFSAQLHTPSDDINCVNCDRGILTKHVGKFGKYYACSMSPRCSHKEQPCQQCEGPMTRTRYKGFKLCVNTTCNHIVPLCEQCGGEMVQRKSANGLFWGCKHFNGDNPHSCKNSINNGAINWPQII